MTTQQKLDNIALLDFRLAGWIVNSKLMGLSDDDILKTVKKIIDVLNIVKKQEKKNVYRERRRQCVFILGYC